MNRDTLVRDIVDHYITRWFSRGCGKVIEILDGTCLIFYQGRTSAVIREGFLDFS